MKKFSKLKMKTDFLRRYILDGQPASKSRRLRNPLIIPFLKGISQESPTLSGLVKKLEGSTGSFGDSRL